MQDVVGENTEESVDFYLNDDTEWVKIPNPRYLSGKLRLVYENLQDLNPGGTEGGAQCCGDFSAGA